MTGFGPQLPNKPRADIIRARQRAADAYNAGRFQEAAQSAQAAIIGGDRDPVILHLLGASLVRIGRLDLGIRAIRDAIGLGLNTPEVWCDLANGQRSSEDIPGAHASLDRAIALDFRHAPAVRGKVTLLHGEGRYEDAARLVDTAMRGAPPDTSLALAFAMIAKAVSRASQAIDLLEQLLVAGRVPHVLLRAVHTDLARLLDGERRYDEAFKHATLAAHAAGPIPQQEFFDTTIAEWTPDRFDAVPRSAKPDPLPVLLVGMPRSGTSLLEQVLAAHPDVAGIGESPALPRLEQRIRSSGWTQASVDSASTEYLSMLRSRAPGKLRVVDKLPGNYTILAAIRRILPEARFIHCVRDARDTCLSCYFQNFGTGHSYARDLELLGHKYIAYERLMRHWRDGLHINMLEVRYETLVEAFEPTVRGILEHIGLSWNDRVLSFHTVTRHVRTASAGQVHRPLFASSIARWRHYERHLAPLLASLGPREPSSTAQ